MRLLLSLILCLSVCTPAYAEMEIPEEPVQETESEFLATYVEPSDSETGNEPTESNSEIVPVFDVPIPGGVLSPGIPTKVSGQQAHRSSPACRRTKSKVHKRKQRAMGKRRSSKGKQRSCKAE